MLKAFGRYRTVAHVLKLLHSHFQLDEQATVCNVYFVWHEMDWLEAELVIIRVLY